MRLQFPTTTGFSSRRHALGPPRSPVQWVRVLLSLKLSEREAAYLPLSTP